MKDLLLKSKIGPKEQIYDYEFVSFLKSQFNLSYQPASLFAKAIKGPLTSDKPYLHREDFLSLFANEQKSTYGNLMGK